MRPMIKVTGIDQCISLCDLISTNVSQAIEKETELGAKAVRKRERELAPVKSGMLRKSIVNRKGKYGITRMVRAKAPHAPLQEYGTKRGVKGKHFAQRARRELLPGIQEKIRTAVRNEVRR
jgi:hypothetical protein